MNRIFLILMAFILGFSLSHFWGYQNNFIKEKKKEKIDFSFLNKVEKKIQEKFVDTREDQSKKITNNDKVFGAAAGLVASYGDQHTIFFPPEENKEFRDDLAGEFSGIGVEISNRKGLLTVVAPLVDSPGFKAGLRPKDVIIEIDGKDSIGMSAFKAVKLIRGKKGTIVKLKIARPGNTKPFDVEIKRDNIKIPVVKTFVKDGVFVIKLYTFSENSSTLFYSKIIKEFRKAKTNKMIIDLRGNTGGFLSAGVFISGLFLEEGKEIVRADYNGKKPDEVYRSGDLHLNPSKTTNIFKNLELGILVDNGSASASEILAGSLVDHKKAILFGENTFGKGTVQEMVEFDNGSSLKVTVAKFILPNGEWISYKGIAPDVKIEMPESEYKKISELGSFSDYIDTQLKKTIKYMSSIKNYQDFEARIEKFSKIREKDNKLGKKKQIDEILKK